jgi:hypothetical protein
MKAKYLLGLSILIIVYSIYCLIRIPTIADALIIISLCSTGGGIFYLLSREIPPKATSPQTEEYLKRIEELRLQREVSTLQMDISRVNSALKVADSGPQKFVF